MYNPQDDININFEHHLEHKWIIWSCFGRFFFIICLKIIGRINWSCVGDECSIDMSVTLRISILTRDGVTWEEILSDVSMSSTESTKMAKGRAAVSSWSLSTTVIISPSSLRYFFPMTTMDILFGVCIPEVWKFNLIARYIQHSHCSLAPIIGPFYARSHLY